MHSPKFKAKARTLSATINASSLRNCWKKKVRDDVRRQIIPDPVEHLDFHVILDAACDALATEITSGSYLPSQVTRVTTEKSKGLCRLIVFPSIRDVLVLQVLADALWAVLKNKAPTKNAFYAPKDHAFLKMKFGLEDEYGPVSEWLKFQKQILGFASRKKFIVVTDIAVTSARYSKKFPPNCLERLLAQLTADEPFQVFSRVWLLSRFRDYKAVRRTVDDKSHIWSQEPILARGIAGMLPLFRGTTQLNSFIGRLSRLGGRSAEAVFEFYEERVFTKKGFPSVSKFIGAKNKAAINGITHSKFLMLYGYLSNPDYSKAEKAKFLLKHVTARQDLYYRFMIDQKLKTLP